MLEIIEFPLPEKADDARWQAYVRLSHANNEELIGGPEWNVAAEATLLSAKTQTDYTIRRFLALLDGEAVGSAYTRVNHVDEPEAVAWYVFVAPQHRGQGIGRALAERLADESRGFARRISWVMIPAPGPDDATLSPSSGIGRVSATQPGIRLATRLGFELGQVERVSRYDLQRPPIDPAEALAEARHHAGAYELFTWEGPASDGILADLARLKQRMSTDVPAGDLTVVETSWDADRLRRLEDQLLATSRMFRAAARHRASGAVVALNELVVERSNESGFVEQWDTIVAPDHRGHRLGLLVKAANIVALRQAVPSAPAIVTWNAEENQHMLAVNTALGFAPMLVEAAFEAKADGAATGAADTCP